MRYEAIVAGGGVMGMASAYALLNRGLRRVLVLERYMVGHDRAASTDRTKAIRYEYAEFEIYSRMVGRSIELWRELEAATGADLYVNCGVVCWGRGDRSFARRSYETLQPLGIPIRELSPDELVSLYPQFNPASIDYATHNPEGGFLRASSCVDALASEVRRLGGEIWENASLEAFSSGESGVEVRTGSGDTLSAERLVLTVGPWSASLLPGLGLQLPLTANKQQVVYIEGLSDEFAPGLFPVFLNLDHEFYGFPLDSAGLLKASIHLPGPVIDPNIPHPPDDDFTIHMMDLLERYIPPAARGRVALARTCMYAMTPDEDFILDHFPGEGRVVIGAGFSGHGFKFAPLIGHLIADLSLDNPTEFPLEGFAISRLRGLERKPNQRPK